MLKERVEPSQGTPAAGEESVALADLDREITLSHLLCFFERNPGLAQVTVIDRSGQATGRLTRRTVIQLASSSALRPAMRSQQVLGDVVGGLTAPRLPRFHCPFDNFEEDYPLHTRRKPAPDCPICKRPMTRVGP